MENNSEKDLNNENLLVLILTMPLFGSGHGLWGLPTHFNWKWVAAGFAVAYLLYAWYINNLLFGLIVAILVILWIRSS